VNIKALGEGADKPEKLREFGTIRSLRYKFRSNGETDNMAAQNQDAVNKITPPTFPTRRK
jgi:hypothetical protein